MARHPVFPDVDFSLPWGERKRAPPLRSSFGSLRSPLSPIVLRAYVVRCALCRAWARLCALRPSARAWGPDSLRSPFGFAVCGLGGERQKTRNLQRSFFQALRRFVWALSLPLARRRQLHRYIERETDRIEQEARRRGDRRRVKEQGMSAQSHFRLLRSPRLVRCQASSPVSQGPTRNDAEPFLKHEGTTRPTGMGG